MLRKTLMLVVVLPFSAVAYGQAPVTSFAELQDRLKTGEAVVVTTEAGEVIHGTVADVSDAALLLMRSTGASSMAAQDVRRVDRSLTSKRLGAAVGFGTGFALGAILDATADCPTTPSGVNFGCVEVPILAAGALVGALGAGVGTAVGAAVHRRQTVFLRAGSPSARIGISPKVSRHSLGLQVRLAW